MRSTLFLLFSLTIPLQSIASELEVRQDIKTGTTVFFLKNKFDRLDYFSKKYLKYKERTSSGIWKLSLFYSGIEGLTNVQNKGDNY